MRIVLLMVAGLALAGFLVVAVVLPQMAGAETRDAAQALLAGVDAAQKQVTERAEKTGNLERLGQGRQDRRAQRSQARRDEVAGVGERRDPRLEREERHRDHADPGAVGRQGRLDLQGLPGERDADDLRRPPVRKSGTEPDFR